MLITGNRVYDELTFEERSWLAFRSLVRKFIEDGLKEGDPTESMGDFFSQWEFGEGLKSEKKPKSWNISAMLKPFFGPPSGLLTDRDMSEWKPYMEPTTVYDGKTEAVVQDWYSLQQMLDQAPWLARLKDTRDPTKGLTDRNIYWLQGLDDEEYPDKKGGVVDYCHSFQLLCKWLYYTPAVEITTKFPSITMLGNPGSVERLEQITEALTILSFEDWKLLKKSKGFRIVSDHFKARRQYEKGKTEILEFLKKWEVGREEVLDSGYLQLQDLLTVDKPTGTEGTQDWRLLFTTWEAAQKLNLVFIFGFPSFKRTKGKLDQELAKRQRTNRIAARVHWGKLVGLLRLSKIRSDTYDPMSGEPADEDVKLNPDVTIWPYTDCGPVSPVWGTMIRTGFSAQYNVVTGGWVYTPRQGNTDANPLSQEDQDYLWDWFRTLIRDRADYVQEQKWLNGLDSPSGRVTLQEIEDAEKKGYFAGLRARQCYVYAIEPPANSKNPVPLQSGKVEKGMMSLEDARVLRNAWGSANVVWIRGYSPIPGRGLAHWMEVAWNFFDFGSFLDTETLNARNFKGAAAEKLLSYHDHHLPVCMHQYNEMCEGDGNGCEGWRDGDSLIEWFYFVQFKLLAKVYAHAWLEPHGDKQKWAGLAALFDYPNKEGDPGKWDDYWVGAIIAGRPIEWVFKRAKGAGGVIKRLWNKAAKPVAWDLIDKYRVAYEQNWAKITKGLTGYAVKAFNARTPGLAWTHEQLEALLTSASDHAYEEAVRGDIETRFVATY